MNVTKENLTDLMAVIKIELVKDDYEPQVNKILKDYQKQADMPGFRPGKVPFSLIVKKYRTAVLVDEINKIISNELFKYIEDNDLKVLGSPLSDEERQKEIDFDEGENFEFYFDVALAPEIDVVLDNTIAVPKYDIEISDEMIKNYITETQSRLGTVIEPETSEINDYLYGSFVQLDEEGNVLEKGITKSCTIAIDTVAGKTIQKKLIGVKVGDVISFNPMKAMKNETEVATMLGITKEIAKDLKSEFNYTLEKITRHVPAELNEELFAKVFPQDSIHSVAEFEDRIKQDAKISFSADTDRIFSRDVMEALIKKYEFPMADEFLKRWIVATADQQKPITAEQVEKDYDQYAKGMRWQILEALIEKKYEVKITKEDVRAHLMELFLGKAAGNKEVEDRASEFVDKFMANEDNKQQVKSVYDHLIEKALQKVYEDNLLVDVKPITYEDFVKIAYGQN